MNQQLLNQRGHGFRSGVSAIAALAAAVLGVGMSIALGAVPANAASGDPFDPSVPYVFVAQAPTTTSTQLYQAVSDGSQIPTFTAVGAVVPMKYGGVAYNEADNYLYAVTLSAGGGFPKGALIRIGQDGVITQVGSSLFVSAGAGVLSEGTFGPGGYLYVASPLNATMDVIDVTTGTLVKTVTLSALTTTPDFTELDGYFWGGDAQGHLVRIDPATGVVTPNLGTIVQAQALESVWVYRNGNLGFLGLGSTGTTYEASITNPASATPTLTVVSSTPGGPAGASSGTSSPGVRDLTVVASVSPSTTAEFVAGHTVTYSFVVTNTGQVSMDNVAVNEGEFSGTGALSPATCPQSSLAAGAQEVCTATYTLTSADVTAGFVSTTATANGTPSGSSTPVVSASSTVAEPTPAKPGLTVAASAGPTSVSTVGQSVTYTYLVTNTGNVDMSGIAVDTSNFSGSGAISGLSCPNMVLVAGQIESCTATYTVTQADIEAGTITDTATVAGDDPDGNSTTSSPSTSTVTAVQSPSLSVTTSADVPTVTAAGDVVTYTFTVTNGGNVPIDNPTVTASSFTGSGPLSAIICTPNTSPLAPGAGEVCTATYTVTTSDLKGGGLSIAAVVQGTDPNGDPVTSSANSTPTTVAILRMSALPLVAG